MENHFFGEWVEVRNEEEKEEAAQYLGLWMKYFQRKVPDLEFVDKQMIYRDKIYGCNKSTLGIKIHMRGKKPENVLSLDDLPIN